MDSLTDLVLDLTQQISINAASGDVWKTLVHRMSAGSCTSEGTPMPLVLEEWPGGRWFRDLGQNQGHLWGLVQVIKPPALLEIQGPLFMSYAVTGHVQFRVVPSAEGCSLTIRHQAVGMIDAEHRAGVSMGWQAMLDNVKSASES